MKKLTLAEAKKQLADRELWLWRQRHWDEKLPWPDGANIVGDRDEDAIFDIFFDVPNIH